METETEPQSEPVSDVATGCRLCLCLLDAQRLCLSGATQWQQPRSTCPSPTHLPSPPFPCYSFDPFAITSVPFGGLLSRVEWLPIRRTQTWDALCLLLSVVPHCGGLNAVNPYGTMEVLSNGLRLWGFGIRTD